ncbi:putative ammonium transporter 3 [Limulus polyphemus]|uniref:Ammonium transporter n=1 Tax=Limulus polyphemus TaxID=6850 RepID=A0ABM1BQL2_LIMPO|nr:putative ammonium transporter 3 [Limulus polyphemus]
MTPDDATWILTASFVIFTMQTGFGLLESGAVTKKNEVNIMMKNAADVILGGITYWMFGYGFQYGSSPGTNPFIGVGSFFLDSNQDEMGIVFATFIFQLSFATTATTIASGAMAERTDFNAYCIFSLVNTLTYCIPAGWLWGGHGFLKNLGAIDFAGSSGVHLLGGCAAFVATVVLKPRLRRYDNGTAPLPMGNPINALVGTFTLWWGWLVFNCGSTFGITNDKWHYAGRAAITTINASLGAGLCGILFTYFKNRKFEIGDIINSILGGLVSITAGCAFFRPGESIFIGAVGGLFVISIQPMFDKIKVDDPVGAIAVHGGGGLWGMVAVGLFIESDPLLYLSRGRKGLFKGGGLYLLGVQLLSCLSIGVWSVTTTFLMLKGINIFRCIRMSPVEEVLGADYIEHNIRHDCFHYEDMMEDLERKGHHIPKRTDRVPPREEWDRYLVEKYIHGAANTTTQEPKTKPPELDKLLDILSTAKFRQEPNHPRENCTIL